MRIALIGLVSTIILAGNGWGQSGYEVQAGKIIVDSESHWRHWFSVAGTMEINRDGVRPTFIRKSTTLDVDGEEVVVAGINAVSNAVEFGGGIKGAGSNLSSADQLMDGRMDTFWEPERSDLLENWWVEIDLGRTVSATRIVLKFVDEELGDPFLHFMVTTSQGEVVVGPRKFRKRFTTSGPNKDQRVFEVDLTKQLPTKWPTVRGDFTGDVIRYVGIGITDSDRRKGRRVSQAEYESLSQEHQGDVEYFRRRPSGKLTLLKTKEDWLRLTGTDGQGPAVHYRHERPRLAEVEVWSVGDNIGTGVLERGGRVTSDENNGSESAVVDGDYFGEVLYWPAVGGYNPNLLLPSEPVDFERQLIVDLGGAYFLDNIRVLQMAPVAHTKPFSEYRVQLSDGSTNAGGRLHWQTVGSMADIVADGPGSERYNDFKFPPMAAKYFSFTYRMFVGRGGSGTISRSFGLSEIQFFGEGYMPESQISSVFEGDSPFIELSRNPQNLATIEWEADEPPGTNLILQTKTGNTVEKITHYYKKNGEEYPGTEEEAAEAYATDKEFFGANSVGPVVPETIPGDDWSGWSQPYFESGEKITSPSPRKYVAIRGTFLTDDPMAAVTLHSLGLNFVTPVAETIAGEVLPSHLENIGQKQQLSYLINVTFDSESRGFDEILIEAPEGVDMKLQQVTVDVTGQQQQTYTAESEGFEVVAESDSLWVRFPEAIKTNSGSVLVELRFEVTIFRFNTFLIGSIGNSAFQDSWQRVDDGDANGLSDSETTVVLALESGDVLGDVQIDQTFTPNGDGINDELAIGFSLMRVGRSAPVAVEVFSLSGRLTIELHDDLATTGRHRLAWNGLDRHGVLVSPGLYLLRINVDVDSGSSRNTSLTRLVNVAY